MDTRSHSRTDWQSCFQSLIAKRHKNQIRARMSDNISELEVTLQTSPQVESSDSRQELKPHVSTGPCYLSRVRRPPQQILAELHQEGRNCNKFY